MAGFEILLDVPQLTELPDSYFSSVRDDVLKGDFLFGKDLIFSRKNRRPDRKGDPLVTIGAPVVDAAKSLTIQGGVNYFDTGIPAAAAMTVMVIVQKTVDVPAAPQTDWPFIIGSSRINGLPGFNLVRTNGIIALYADYIVGGNPAHTVLPQVAIGAANNTVCCIFAACDGTRKGVYDMTRNLSQELAPEAGNTGRSVPADTLTIGGSPATIYRGPHRIWRVKVWHGFLEAAERAEEYKYQKALYADQAVPLVI